MSSSRVLFLWSSGVVIALVMFLFSLFSPEQKLARTMLDQMERAEALERIEQATFNLAAAKESAAIGQGDKLDLARWEQEARDASEAANQLEIPSDDQINAMAAAFRKIHAKGLSKTKD